MDAKINLNESLVFLTFSCTCGAEVLANEWDMEFVECFSCQRVYQLDGKISIAPYNGPQQLIIRESENAAHRKRAL